MMAAVMRLLPSVQALARARWVRYFTGSGWPALAGLGAGVLGLVMLVAAMAFQWQAAQLLEARANAIERGRHRANASIQLAAADGALFQAPAHGTHLEDVARLFKLAKAKGVNIGAIEYRSETSAALPILIRTLDLRINEPYPKFKAFVADLLSSMPHVFLQEIQVEQGHAPSYKEQYMLKLSFVYQTAAGNNAVPATAQGQHSGDGTQGVSGARAR